MADERPTSERRKPRRKVLTPVHFFLRGLAISLPPILTIVILLWFAGLLNDYIVYPAGQTVRFVLAQMLDDSEPTGNLVRLPDPPPLRYTEQTGYLVTQTLRERYLTREPQRRNAAYLVDQADEVYVPLGARSVPYPHYAVVAGTTPTGEMPRTATGVYMVYAGEAYFGSQFLLSTVAVILIVLLLYFIGRFVNARLGSWALNRVETQVLGRLPVIRNVYGSVKQVTDFLFSENQVEYRRVVAIEYPRRGIWSLGLVTGESMLDITAAIGEPCLSVLIPSSPMPVTGYTMSVPRSEVLDLDISVDQAMQFCVSCGVLVPPAQKVTPELLQQQIARRLEENFRQNNNIRRAFADPSASLPIAPASEPPPGESAE